MAAVPPMPPPGGIGAGTTYRIGHLQALREGILQTDMYVYPDGYRPSTPGLDWLYSAATNRVEACVEVVALYYRTGSGRLGVFDWSCSPEYPCEDGSTDPSWVWISQQRDFECNIGEFVDPGGHLQKVVRYSNASRNIGEGTPPRWENAVYLWNFCEAAWDRVYRHRYRDAKQDCSTGYACSWWGPILETFPNTAYQMPEINELGYANTSLLHDGILSRLGTTEANFGWPVAPWRLFHNTPHDEWAVGNRVMATRNVGNKVAFRVRASSQQYVPRSPACPAGYAGEFRFSARLRNTGNDALTGLIVEIDELEEQHVMQVGGRYPGAGQWFEVPRTRGYRDGILSSGEVVPVPFRICLAEKVPFAVHVNVRTR